MWDGGAGNEESRRGTALRLSRSEERDSVVNVDAMAGRCDVWVKRAANDEEERTH